MSVYACVCVCVEAGRYTSGQKVQAQETGGAGEGNERKRQTESGRESTRNSLGRRAITIQMREKLFVVVVLVCVVRSGP